MLPLLDETGIQVSVSVECSIGTDLVAGAELADAGFEQILLDRPPHQVVLDGGLGNLLIKLDGFVVVFAFERNKVSSLQPQLVSKGLFRCVSLVQKSRRSRDRYFGVVLVQYQRLCTTIIHLPNRITILELTLSYQPAASS
jgi:hypothetical protein